MTPGSASPDHAAQLNAAWERLWTPNSPYDVRTLLTRQILAGGHELSPLTTLSLPSTGSIKLLRTEAWGTVALELDDIVLDGLPSIAGLGIYIHDGAIAAEISFADLQLRGTYRVATGGQGSPAAKTMVDAVARKYGAISAAAAPLGDTSDQGLINATTYRSQLAQTANGRQMVGTYYDNNDAFNDIMSHPVMRHLWKTSTTPDENNNPQDTSYYANQATVATNPGSTAAVNGTPDNQGNSPFNMHSFTMSTFVISQGLNLYCTYSDSGNSRYDPAKAQQVLAAVQATLGFETNAKPPSAQSQTAASVMTTVQNGTPQPPPPPQPDCKPTAPELAHATMLAAAWSNEPEWLQQTRSKARATFHAHLAAWKSAAPPFTQGPPEYLRGEFSAQLPAFNATIAGTISPSLGASSARFTTLTAKVPQPKVVLAGDPGGLLTQVQTAVDKAAFLRGVLRQRILQQLQQGGLVSRLNAALHFAATGTLG